MRTLFKAILATVALAAPVYANAIPITWNYSGVCLSGDCSEVPSVSGTLTGDPSLFGDPDYLSEFIIGEVLSYSFSFGSHVISGTGAIGKYQLNANRDIIGGSMIFGESVAQFRGCRRRQLELHRQGLLPHLLPHRHRGVWLRFVCPRRSGAGNAVPARSGIARVWLGSPSSRPLSATLSLLK